MGDLASLFTLRTSEKVREWESGRVKQRIGETGKRGNGAPRAGLNFELRIVGRQGNRTTDYGTTDQVHCEFRMGNCELDDGR